MSADSPQPRPTVLNKTIPSTCGVGPYGIFANKRREDTFLWLNGASPFPISDDIQEKETGFIQ